MYCMSKGMCLCMYVCKWNAQFTCVEFAMALRLGKLQVFIATYQNPYAIHHSPFTIHRSPFTIHHPPLSLFQLAFAITAIAVAVAYIMHLTGVKSPHWYVDAAYRYHVTFVQHSPYLYPQTVIPTANQSVHNECFCRVLWWIFAKFQIFNCLWNVLCSVKCKFGTGSD